MLKWLIYNIFKYFSRTYHNLQHKLMHFAQILMLICAVWWNKYSTVTTQRVCMWPEKKVKMPIKGSLENYLAGKPKTRFLVQNLAIGAVYILIPPIFDCWSFIRTCQTTLPHESIFSRLLHKRDIQDGVGGHIGFSGLYISGVIWSIVMCNTWKITKFGPRNSLLTLKMRLGHIYSC